MSTAPVRSPRRVVFVINHVAFFVSHRLPIALAARARGWSVALVTGQAGSAAMEPAAEATLAAAGIPHTRTRFTASGVNPLVEGFGALQVFFALVRLRPQVVHCASPKGIMLGGVAARCLRVPRVVLAVSGLGFAFTDGGGAKSALRRVAAWGIRLLGRISLRNPRARIVVQNQDDAREIRQMLGPERTDRVLLIPGSGVDVRRARALPMSEKQPLVLLPGRVVRDKGVAEFAEAATVLRARHPGWRFVVAGSADYENPSAIPAAELDRWRAAGAVEFVGHVSDIDAWMDAASIVCLPSYREGMPKALLDAAAWGCAVVTTDVPGCRDAVEAGVTALVVPPRNSTALTDAIERLILDPSRRAGLGRAGRHRAEREYALDGIVDRLLALYE